MTDKTKKLSRWYSLTPEQVMKRFSTDEHTGISQSDVEGLKEKHGENKLPEAKPDTLLTIFINQFKSSLIYLLLAAGTVVLLLGEYIDGGIIFFVLIFNAIVGTIQANKAQNTLEALKKFSQTNSTVLRDGKEETVPDTEIVPGDIVILQEGEKVPSDGRIISSHNLSVNEAALTGESEPSSKYNEVITEKNVSIGDQKNMVFKGTNVVSGNAVMVVTSVGLETYIGGISKEISTIRREIPLQRDVKHLSHLLIAVVILLAGIIFTYGVVVGESLHDMFVLAIAVIVSAIPEGLPIVLTLLLATGVWRMSQRNVLIKQLQAVEALGEARVIAVDKTGTITKNELVIQEVYSHGVDYTVSGVGYEPEGEIQKNGKTVKNPGKDKYLEEVARLGVFNSDARLFYNEEDEQWTVSGDPTEAAFLVLAKKAGIDREAELERYPQLDELPFESKRKYHAVLHSDGRGKIIAVVGAPEVLLAKCTHYFDKGTKKKLTEEEKEKITERFTAMSAEGIRVLALATRRGRKKSLSHDDIDGLTFTGMFGMRDALRAEVKDAVGKAHLAGIRVVMITGDHKITAQAIAGRAGIYREGDEVVEGADIESLSEQELADRIGNVTVFARVSPEHKFKIVSAYKLRGEIIAMTGDGVNDALSLVAADLGMSMGRQGTEVAKEASDLIILDDDFASIIAAVEEGRSIYKGIKKVLLFLFSTNLAEILIIIGALLMGLPLPVLAAQIIWLNFVTDGLLDAALAMEPKERGLLKGTFKRPSRWIVDGQMAQRMGLMSGAMVVGSLFLYVSYAPTVDAEHYAKAITVAVTAMAAFQWLKVWNCRTDRYSIFHMNPFSNKYLVWAVVIIVSLHVFAVYTPFMQNILSFVPLTFFDWVLIFMVALSTILVDELWKLGRYFLTRGKPQEV